MTDTAQVRALRLPDPRAKYRVVQWATGRIGGSSLKELLRSPQMDVVGVYVHSESKAGKDAGELVGMSLVGVTATTDIEQILELKPDCVVAMQEGANVDDVCRFLSAGINVVTSRVDYLEPGRMDPAVRSRVEQACQQGGASLHATGASPGFSSEALPLVVASMSREIECLTIDEFADLPASVPDAYLVGSMRYGRQPGDEFDPRQLAHTSHGFEQSLAVIARGLGVALDGFEVSGETANAAERFLLPGGTPIEKGTVAAQRITVCGMRGGTALLRYLLNWYVSRNIDKDWDLRRSGWRMVIEGPTPIDVNVTFPLAPEKVSPAMAAITANRVINAIPYVVVAEPGICTTVDLPVIVPQLD